MSREDPQFKLRLPEEINKAVRCAAKNEHRSLNSWFLLAAKEKLERDGGLSKEAQT